MEILEIKLESVFLIKPVIFEDFRGSYTEAYNEKEYTRAIKEKTGVEVKFVQDDYSISSKNVLRGIHGDSKTWKLINCPIGRIYAVIVNCDESSKGFGAWEPFIISEGNGHQILIPPKFGTSHLVLSNRAMFHYKQSTYYDPKNLPQFTYKWNEPRFNIWWPIKNPLLSRRDAKEKR